jgi:hypothetical protein
MKDKGQILFLFGFTRTMEFERFYTFHLELILKIALLSQFMQMIIKNNH